MKLAAFVLCFLLALHHQAFAKGPWRGLTEESPPYNYSKNGKIKGLCTDIVKELFRRSKLNMTLAVMPWSRSLRTAETKPLHFVYSTARTPERENRFKWVGPLYLDEWAAFALKDSPIKYTDRLDSLKPYRFAGLIDDAVSELLISKGFNVDLVSSDEQNFVKLKNKRVDLFPSTDLNINSYARTHKVRIKKVAIIERTALYAAFNKSTPNHIIERLNQELKAMEKEGVMQKIIDGYVQPAP